MSYKIHVGLESAVDFSPSGFSANELSALDGLKALRNISPEKIALMRQEARDAAVRAQRKKLLDALEGDDDEALVRAMSNTPDTPIDVYGTTALHYILDRFETIKTPFFLEAALGMNASLTVQDKRGRNGLDRLDDDMRRTVRSVMCFVGRSEEAKQLFGDAEEPEDDLPTTLRPLEAVDELSDEMAEAAQRILKNLFSCKPVVEKKYVGNPEGRSLVLALVGAR